MKYLFYLAETPAASATNMSIEKRYTCVLWRPSWGRLVPRGLPLLPFAVWWVFHRLHLFFNRDYCLFLIYDGQTCIHRTCVFPGYFRFPFMKPDDLQIGDTWTAESHRGHGLATYAIRKVLQMLGGKGRQFWYITDETNTASIRAAEKGGYRFVGNGKRMKRCGLRVLGAFVLDEPSKTIS